MLLLLMMLTIILMVMFGGCFLFYTTSKKVKLDYDFFIFKWFPKNKKVITVLGALLIFICLIIDINRFGNIQGVLYWLFQIIAMFSFIVIFYPLKRVLFKHLIIFFISILFIELIFK